MRLRAARLAALAGLLLFIVLASTAAAASGSVEISNFAFSPPSVTINAGEKVTWTNQDRAAHSAVFANGGPQTPVLSNGQSASLTFLTSGTFNYVCGIHGAGMSGAVTVLSAARTELPTTSPATLAPTSTPTPTPTASPAPTSAAPSTNAPSVVAAVPTEQAPAPAAANDRGGPPLLLIGGAAIAVIAVAGAVLTRIRR
jgi:plastocyanin